MAKPRQAEKKSELHRYLIVPLTDLLTHPHLPFMMWPTDPGAWAEARSLLYHSYAVSEHHTNVSIIAVYLDNPRWTSLHGDHQDVRTMI